MEPTVESFSILQWLTNNLGIITMLGIVVTAIVGVVSVFAIFRSPIVALRLQKEVEDYNEKRSRQMNIFKTLLGTRANPLALEHVQALNMIDIEFYEEKEIREAWNIYRDHLNSPSQNQDTSAQERWLERKTDLFTDLLYIMSKFFEYDFDKVILKKGAYSPIAHDFLNMEGALIRKGLVKVLNENKAIKIESVVITEKQERI